MMKIEKGKWKIGIAALVAIRFDLELGIMIRR